MSEIVSQFSITLRQLQDYEFSVKFDSPVLPELHTDETPPLGKDAGPSPTRMIAAAIGNCLSASLLFAFRKAGVSTGEIEAAVTVRMVRNERRRIRIGKIEVVLDPKLAAGDLEKAKGPRGLFEDFCTVTQSVQQGIPVEIKVKGFDGE